ncbi:MAG: hypothetical protein ACNS62_21265 [Candidatus Cyclobacteriaceae bacterium M3_2C_046]
MKKMKVNLRVEANGDKTAKIYLDGELSIQNSTQIKNKLLGELKKHDQLEIIVNNAEAFDISCIQIFYSLSKTASTMNKSITYSLTLPKELGAIIAHSGFNNLLQSKVSLVK